MVVAAMPLVFVQQLSTSANHIISWQMSFSTLGPVMKYYEGFELVGRVNGAIITLSFGSEQI